MGRKAAEENVNEIREALKDADMVFVTCGLGGGTGTGAAPIVADIARELGALTVAVVTKPFSFEGAKRREVAERGYAELKDRLDTIITIPNDRVFGMIEKNTSLSEAFRIVDDVLRQGVQGISELITVPGLINVDFADVRTIMLGQGSALMGIGRAAGENRATEAAKQAIASPLLEVSIDGARGILFTITGGPDLSMHEVAEAAKVITANADPDAKVIFGTVLDPSMGDEIKVTVVATGFDGREQPSLASSMRSVLSAGSVAPKYPERPAMPRPYAPPPAPPSVNRAPEPPKARFEDESAFPKRVKPVDPDAARRSPAPSAPATDDVSDTPAFLRKAVPPAQPNASDEEIDIPAFIRKKML
jgi:cell division protein FtsZ